MEWLSDGQGELFEGLNQESGKNKRKPVLSLDSGDAETVSQSKKPNSKRKINKESILFSILMAILLALASYFTGIERGKVVAKDEVFERQKQEIIRRRVMPAKASHLVPVQPQTEPLKSEIVSLVNSYAIQVVTYIKLDPAKKEIESLQKRGFSSFHYRSGKYYVVCVGPFVTQENAKAERQRLTKIYRDCFVKKIEQKKL